MTFFIIALVLINLGLWIIFLFKFKDLFSTDKIIEKTRYEMEKLVKDINNNAETNINIIDERVRKMKALVREADLKIEQIETRLSLLNKQISDINLNNVASVQRNAKKSSSQYEKKSSNQNFSYSVTQTGMQFAEKQKTLFDANDTEVFKESSGYSKNSSSLYQTIPVVSPSGFEFEVVSENKENQSDLKNLNIPRSELSVSELRQKIILLHSQGKSMEAIASSLSITPAEVQFALDFLD